MKRLTVKQLKYLGFLGFLGFFGFSYFQNHDVSNLFYFSFFSFFSYFFIGGLMSEKPDERYIENDGKARSKVMWIPLAALFIIGYGMGWSEVGFPFAAKEFAVVVSAIGWSATFIAYAALFYYYEKGDS